MKNPEAINKYMCGLVIINTILRNAEMFLQSDHFCVIRYY